MTIAAFLTKHGAIISVDELGGQALTACDSISDASRSEKSQVKEREILNVREESRKYQMRFLPRP